MINTNCQQIQMELFDYLGRETLPSALAEHVSTCDDCRSLWQELTALSVDLGDDELFYPEPNEIAILSAKVDMAVSNLEPSQPHVWNMLINYLIPIAASVILLLGIAFMGNRINKSDNSFNSEDSLYSAIVETDIEELDESTIGLLLEDFSSYRKMTPGELLLDDLSDDELEYLVNNMNIGDLM